jgi:hypothetical protein
LVETPESFALGGDTLRGRGVLAMWSDGGGRLMASLRQKPSGRWEARYRDDGGRMHARTFATKTEATRWSKEVETDVRRGDWVDPRLARTSFGEWADEYLTAIVHLRSVTRGDYA